MCKTRRAVDLLCFLLPQSSDQHLFLHPRGREPSCQVLLTDLHCGVIIVINHTIPARPAGDSTAVLQDAVVEVGLTPLAVVVVDDGVVIPVLIIHL